MLNSDNNVSDLDPSEKERQKMLKRHLVENQEFSAFDMPDESLVIEKLRNLLRFIAETTVNGISKDSLEEKDKALRTIKDVIEAEFMASTLKST